MLLSDLLGSAVNGDDGHRLGVVVDVRFVIDSAPVELLASARVHGIVVGRHAAHSFMGYERNGEKAPAPIARFLRWRERGSFLVLWPDVGHLGEDGVILRPGYSRYSPELP